MEVIGIYETPEEAFLKYIALYNRKVEITN